MRALRLPAQRRIPRQRALARRLATGGLMLLALAGCATTGPFPTPLAPATLGHSVQQRQEVTIAYRGHHRSLQVALGVTPERLTMIGLSPLGGRLFTLSWDGHESHLSSRMPHLDRLDPKRIITDLQLAYWPLPVLRATLPPGLRLERIGTARILWRNNTLLWFASSGGRNRWQTPQTIYDVRRGYRLRVQPLTDDGRPVHRQAATSQHSAPP